jgi:hypothetical protein
MVHLLLQMLQRLLQMLQRLLQMLPLIHVQQYHARPFVKDARVSRWYGAAAAAS